MKRLNLWLRELSLSQQIIAIIFVFISTFALFLFLFISPSLDSFSETEMYRLLHNSQESLLSYIDSFIDEDVEIPTRENSLILEGIYDEEQGLYMLSEGTFSSELMEDIKKHAASEKAGTQDYSLELSADETTSGEAITYLYSMTLLKDGSYLISVIDNSYRTQFRSSLINAVVYMNVLVVSVLFVLLMLWVSTLIVPLSQIKNYITKVKNEEPAELNVHRRDAIGEVADALRDMKNELDKQNHEKEEMVQNISHDLKTPIATIKSYGESIKDGIYPYDTLEKSVDVIIEHADRLEKKVQSLITLNKMVYLEDNCPPGDTVNMNKIIDKVILSLKVIRPEISLQKETDTNIFFHGLEEPWQIVIENLIDNGLRYAKTHIRVVLRKNELMVINDGQPIREEDLDRIFRPYEKGTDGKFGLGLSIVHKVCTTYGYKVDAENLPGEVSFRIWREEKKEKKRRERDKTGEK